MNILFVIVFIILHEVLATVGAILMGIFHNWIAIIIIECAVGFLSAMITVKIFRKKKISNIAKYVCIAFTIFGCILNLYSSGFGLSLLGYNIVGIIAVYAGLLEAF